ncbi:MAG: alpha/beta hydrolase [bacterium]|nr:alpha/beta hydrolase [bacterium]
MKIIVNSLAIEYEDTGTGPVVLFLHGWKDDLHTFYELVPLLQGFRLVRVDFPGFGGSELPQVAWSTREYADFVADFCKKIVISPEIIVGHSFGGRVTLKGVSSGILTPKKLVLIASAGLAKYKTSKVRLFLFAAKAGKAVLFFLPYSHRERLRRRLYGAAGSGDYMNIHTGVLKETFLKAIREDLTDSAKEIHLPTLLIWGKQDVVTPFWDGKRLQTLISDSKLEVLNDATHFVHQEKPQEVAELIKKFII